jgi:hypothetical protein
LIAFIIIDLLIFIPTRNKKRKNTTLILQDSIANDFSLGSEIDSLDPNLEVETLDTLNEISSESNELNVK